MKHLSIEDKLLNDIESLDADEGISINSTHVGKTIYVNKNLMDIFILLKIDNKQILTPTNKKSSTGHIADQMNNVKQEFYYIDDAIDCLKFINKNLTDFSYYMY